MDEVEVEVEAVKRGDEDAVEVEVGAVVEAEVEAMTKSRGWGRG